MQYKNIYLIIIVTTLIIMSFLTPGCIDTGSDEIDTTTPTPTETATETETPAQTQTAKPTPDVTPASTAEPQLINIRITNYMFIPQAGTHINVGDTVKWRNFEDSKHARYLVNENGIWDEEQYIRYMREVQYTFNETGVYTFYLKGRESIKFNVTVV